MCIRRRIRFKRTGLVVDPAKDAIAEAVTCYAIASVFTPPDNRGKGFARHMMRLLHWVIADEALLPASEFPAAWGAPPLKLEGTRNGHSLALWSDVGDFYSTCGPVPGVRDGLVVRGTDPTMWDVDSTTVSNTILEWIWLDDSGVSHLWVEDAEEIRQDLEIDPSGVTLAFLPT
ncbi:hypothetical protein B0H17DRAFT_1081941 [Mycena rosella]|uniref:N-acetyltransferase domain-containing protein n=1 Tax=Mycena rosella TaxID=1033263 RepID=A0AAD7G7H9_MYCRO|nr:hypothetical protein B0H17DRAFT_1081941 [Mycena rosella]